MPIQAFLFCFVRNLVLSMFLGACAAPTATQAPAATTAPQPTTPPLPPNPRASAKSYKIGFLAGVQDPFYYTMERGAARLLLTGR